MFRRILPLASDDFFIYGFIHFLINITAIFIVSFLISRYSAKCLDVNYYLIIQLVIIILDTILDSFIMWISLQGTIAYSKPRRHMSTLLYIAILILILQILNQIVGLLDFHQTKTDSCQPGSGYVSVLGFFIYTTLFCSGLVLFLAITSIISGYPHVIGDHERPKHIRRAITPLFWGTTFLNRNHDVSPKKILQDVASILTDIFGS